MFDEDTLAKANLDIAKEEESDATKELAKERKKEVNEIHDTLFKQEVVQTDPDYNIYKPLVSHLTKYQRRLPMSVKNIMGCDGCEWRGTYECPHGIVTKDPNRNTKTAHIRTRHGNGICRMREDYLVWIGGEWDKQPTHAQYMSRYHKRIMDIVNGNDYKRMQKVMYELEAMEANENIDEKELAVKRKEYWLVRRDWIELAKLCQETTDRQVDRETVKKVEVNETKTMTLTQMQEIMRGEVVEAEFEVEDES